MAVVGTQLRTGQRPAAPNVRTYKEGEVLFKEGDKGREMFMIVEGEIRISRASKDGEIELVRLGNGSILGEMSLLDNLPRSATGTATKPTKVSIVNEMVFNSVLAKVPPWLTSIVRIITSRVRDANKRVGQSILRNREAGVASLIALLLENHQKVLGGIVSLDFDLVITESYYTCRLGKTATESVLADLAKRQIIEIAKDSAGKQNILFRDLDVFTLFVEFTRLKERGREFVELQITDPEVDLLNNVIYVSQKSGKETKQGTELPMKALIEDMAQKNVTGIEKMLSSLQRRDVLNMFPAPDGSENVILFRKESLTRIRKIKEWIERFRMDLHPPESKSGAGKGTKSQ